MDGMGATHSKKESHMGASGEEAPSKMRNRRQMENTESHAQSGTEAGAKQQNKQGHTNRDTRKGRHSEQTCHREGSAQETRSRLDQGDAETRSCTPARQTKQAAQKKSRASKCSIRASKQAQKNGCRRRRQCDRPERQPTIGEMRDRHTIVVQGQQKKAAKQR